MQLTYELNLNKKKRIMKQNPLEFILIKQKHKILF